MSPAVGVAAARAKSKVVSVAQGQSAHTTVANGKGLALGTTPVIVVRIAFYAHPKATTIAAPKRHSMWSHRVDIGQVGTANATTRALVHREQRLVQHRATLNTLQLPRSRHPVRSRPNGEIGFGPDFGFQHVLDWGELYHRNGIRG